MGSTRVGRRVGTCVGGLVGGGGVDTCVGGFVGGGRVRTRVGGGVGLGATVAARVGGIAASRVTTGDGRTVCVPCVGKGTAVSAGGKTGFSCAVGCTFVATGLSGEASGSHDHQDRDGDDEDRQKPAEQGSRAPLRAHREEPRRPELAGNSRSKSSPRASVGTKGSRALGHDVRRDTWFGTAGSVGGSRADSGISSPTSRPCRGWRPLLLRLAERTLSRAPPAVVRPARLEPSGSGSISSPAPSWAASSGSGFASASA